MESVREDVAALMSASSAVSADQVPVADKVSDPEKYIWDFLIGKIGNAAGVAGLMGNLYAESGLKSNNLQNSYNKRLNISDEDYTRLVDGDNYPDFVKDKSWLWLGSVDILEQEEGSVGVCEASGQVDRRSSDAA